MHLQPINSTTPNFQANHLRSVKIINNIAKKNTTAIDIYSIDKSDKNLINALLLKIDLKERSDSSGLKEKNSVNNTIRSVLNKALSLEDDKTSGVYVAVKDNRKVIGVLDYTNGGIPLLKNLLSWQRNKNIQNASRENLFAEFMQNIKKSANSQDNPTKIGIATFAEPDTKGHKWLKDTGFYAPKQMPMPRERLVIDKDMLGSISRLKECVLQKISDMKIERNTDKTQVNLEHLSI